MIASLEAQLRDKEAQLRDKEAQLHDKDAELRKEIQRSKQLNRKLQSYELSKQKAADAKKKKIFPFEKLSPELRNMIYGYLLPCDGTIEISRMLTGNGKKRDATLHSIHRPSPSMRVRGVPGSSLLRTNRAIHAEALPMLYGANQFEFQSPAALKHFLEYVGPAVNELRDISLPTGYEVATLQRSAALFVDIDKLEHFRVTAKLWAHIGDLTTCADDLARILATFVKLGETQADRRRRFDMICLKCKFPYTIHPAFTAFVMEGVEDTSGITTETATEIRVKKMVHVRLVARGILLPENAAQ